MNRSWQVWEQFPLAKHELAELSGLASTLREDLLKRKDELVQRSLHQGAPARRTLPRFHPPASIDPAEVEMSIGGTWRLPGQLPGMPGVAYGTRSTPATEGDTSHLPPDDPCDQAPSGMVAADEPPYEHGRRDRSQQHSEISTSASAYAAPANADMDSAATLATAHQSLAEWDGIAIPCTPETAASS